MNLQLCCLLLVGLFFNKPLWAEENAVLKSVVPILMTQQNTAAGPTTFAVTEYENLDAAQIKSLLGNSDLKTSDLVVSTDNADVQQDVVDSVLNNKNTDRRIKLLPFGALLGAKSTFNKVFSHYLQSSKETLTNDKIGVTIMVLTTAYDSFVWMHASSYSTHQKTSMLVYNFLMAATFGLNRDLWANMVAPMKHSIINNLEKVAAFKNSQNLNLIASQFLANVTFSVGLQVLRSAFLSIDSLSHAVTTSQFWATSLMVGSLATFASSAWSELNALIDYSKNPASKILLRRFSDMRVVFLSYFATTAMVFQPQVYGQTPALTLILSGSLGIFALLNKEKVIQLIEGSTTLAKIYTQLDKIESQLNFNSRQKALTATPLVEPIFCSQLFQGF